VVWWCGGWGGLPASWEPGPARPPFGGARLLRLAVIADSLFGTAQGNSLSGFALVMAYRCSRDGLCCTLCRSRH